MIVPTQRLLLGAAVVVVPLATAAGFAPGMALLCGAVLGLCAIAAAIDAVRARMMLQSLDARTPESLRLTKGVAGHLPVSIENAGPDAVFRLGVVMPAGVHSASMIEEVAAPAGTSRFDWPCTGIGRGEHRLGALHLEVTSPAGLWAARKTRTAGCSLRVYPNLRDRATAALFLRSANIGMKTPRQIGKGREFDNLRQYLPGDNFEDIYWKATARRHFPVVKLYRVENAQEVYAIIDASRLSARPEILDSYVDAALHLALVAERQSDRFGLLTFSDRPHTFVRARSGMDHFRLCRETIFNLEPRRVSPDFREVFAHLQTTLRRRALLVFFTSLDDALLSETFEREIAPLSRRHVVRVHVTQPGARPLFTGDPPADVEGVYGSLAAQMISNRLRKLSIALSNLGVRLTVVDPANVKVRVAAEYMDVKRRQVL